MVIADAGFWVALNNPSDRFHQPARSAASRWQDAGFITTHAVIAEASHILRKQMGRDAMVWLVEALHAADTQVFEFGAEAFARLKTLMHKYRDLPMDYADASLVLLAEHLGHGRILTTDQRDFGTYRWKNHYPFESVLEEDIE